MAKMPSAWTAIGSKSKTTAGTKVSARIDMSAEVAGAGKCPDCQQPMIEMIAGPVETLTCMNCRIALPTKDPEEVVQDDAASKASAGPSTYLDQ